MYTLPLVSKLFYAVLLSSLQTQQSAPGWTTYAINLVGKLVPGMAGRLSRWMSENNRFPWRPVDAELIAFGSGAAVFKIFWKSGAKVLRIYRRSLGKSKSDMFEVAAYYKKNYDTIRAWYGGALDLVLPMEFLVLQGLPLVGPVAASLQPYVQGVKQDLFEDFKDDEFARLLNDHPLVRDQFLFFAEQTMCRWDERKMCYDFVGRENIMLVKQGANYSLKIVDVGIFKFDIPAHRHPQKIAQIEQRVQRLNYLYELAKRN